MATISQLDAVHPTMDYPYHQRLWALCRGGQVWRQHMPSWLPQRVAETPAAYARRCAAALYVNKAGPVVDTFAQWLFEEPAVVAPEALAKAAAPADGGLPPNAAAAAAFTHALVHGRGWVFVTQPAAAGAFTSLAEQEAAGGLRPLYRVVDPLDVLDWELSEDGRVVWAITRELTSSRAGAGAARAWRVEWSYITAESITTYTLHLGRLAVDGRLSEAQLLAAARRPGGLATLGGPAVADLPLESRVAPLPPGSPCPLVSVELPPGLWAMDRMHDAALGHLRANHARDWALDASAFAMLVHKVKDSGGADALQVGPGFSIPMDPDEDLAYVEPSGRAFTSLRESVLDYEQDIYRVMRQMALASSAGAGGAAVAISGAAKMRDMDPMRTVLAAYRMVVVGFVARLVATGAALATGSPVPVASVEVSGLDAWRERSMAEFFEASALAQSTGATAMSPRLAKEIALGMARMLLAGQQGESALAEIEDEIMASDPEALLLAGTVGGGPLGDDVRAALAGVEAKDPDPARSRSATDGQAASGQGLESRAGGRG